MHKLNWLAVILVLMIATPLAVRAQGRFDLFGGYSYTNYSPKLPPVPVSVSVMRGLDGWNASLEARPFPFAGIVADFGNYSGMETTGLSCLDGMGCDPDNHTVRLFTFLLGPQVSFSIGRFTPFVHVLLGGARVSQDIYACGCVLGQPVTGTGTSSSRDTALAYAIGGGVDYKLGGPIRLRVQVDALQTRLPNPNDLIPKSTQANLRLSTGVVFHF